MKKTLLLILIYSFSIHVFAQWTNFNTSNTKALDATLVTDIALSGKMIVWFATDNGLVKHDLSIGTWERINNLPNNFVYDIEIDKSYKVWAATNGGGVVKYDGQSIQTFNTGNGLANNIVRSIAIDKQDYKWFATYGGGISRYKDSEWRNFGLADGLPTKYFYSAFCDSQGNLWFGTSGKGVVRYTAGAWHIFNNNDGLLSNTITRIYEDSKHRMWFCGDGGVSIYDGINFQNLTKANGLSDDMVYSVTEDVDGNFRIGTDNGLNIWNGSQIEKLDTTDGLVNNTILCIAYDQKGRYWYGHPHGGATCFDGINWYNYGEANGLLSNYVYKAVQGKDGKMWFATDRGITRYDGKIWQTIVPGADTYYYFYDMDIDKQGNIWAFEERFDYLYKFDGINWNIITTPLSGNFLRITEIYCDKQGNMWLAYYTAGSNNSNGILKYTDGIWEKYDKSNSPINNTIYCMFNDSKGNLWIGTYYGLLKKSASGWTSYTTSDGLADNYVSKIAEDHKGNIWVACYNYNNGGLSKFDGTKWTTYRDQIHTHYITTLFVDSNDKLWIAGQYQNSNNYTVFTKYKNGNWENQQGTLGLPFTYNYYDIIEDNTANLWVCSNSGISTGNLTIVSVDDIENSSYEKVENYPNPFNTETKVKLNLEKAGDVEVEIIGISGNVLRIDTYGNLTKGENEITIEKGDLKSGIYLNRINAGDKIITNKMIVF